MGQITVFNLPGCKIWMLFDWSVTAQSYPFGITRGAGLLGVEVVFLMVTAWFSMRYFPWRQRTWVLYLCTCVTLGVSVDFCFAAGGIGSV